jgi:hypothetical protein
LKPCSFKTDAAEDTIQRQKREVAQLFFSTAESLSLPQEMGRPVTKKLLWSGNATVFRGSVQHLRVVFNTGREAPRLKTKPERPSH